MPAERTKQRKIYDYKEDKVEQFFQEHCGVERDRGIEVISKFDFVLQLIQTICDIIFICMIGEKGYMYRSILYILYTVKFAFLGYSLISALIIWKFHKTWIEKTQMLCAKTFIIFRCLCLIIIFGVSLAILYLSVHSYTQQRERYKDRMLAGMSFMIIVNCMYVFILLLQIIFWTTSMWEMLTEEIQMVIVSRSYIKA